MKKYVVYFVIVESVIAIFINPLIAIYVFLFCFMFRVDMMLSSYLQRHG